MKTGLRSKIRLTERLGFRIGFLLSVALLPLGMIALSQTWHIAGQAERSAETALLRRTAEAGAGERTLILTALGAAQALGQAAAEYRDDPVACSALLKDFVTRSGIYIFAGFVRADGKLDCASTGATADVSGTETYRTFMNAPGPLVSATRSGTVTHRSVTIVSQPVTEDGALLGYLALSIPHDTIERMHRGMGDDRHVDVVIFNAYGNVVFAEGGLDNAQQNLPESTLLARLTETEGMSFRDRDLSGADRVFAVVPVVPGLVYAMGSWLPKEAMIGRDLIGPTTILFPLTMWLTSLIVAYAAVDRLVIRHIRELRGQMRRFALGRRDRPPEVLVNAPAEITDVSQTFHNLARILIRDEAELAASVEEKTVLLREVHHRVKNNLQLIASIMNMQMRQVSEPTARRVLKSVQDRVASLASIHRNLYQAETLSAVQADQLLSDIVSQMAVIAGAPGRGLRIMTEFDPITLFPDQAVPVALLATEAVTNAVKYAEPPEPGTNPWIRVSLRTDGAGTARLSVVNSRDAASVPEDDRGTGLGTKLINAFAAQLGTEAIVSLSDTDYALSMTFRVADLADDAEEAPPLREAPEHVTG